VVSGALEWYCVRVKERTKEQRQVSDPLEPHHEDGMAKFKPNPIAALNFARDHGFETMPTDDWIRILRDGEED
jgi:hypothetical protein